MPAVIHRCKTTRPGELKAAFISRTPNIGTAKLTEIVGAVIDRPSLCLPFSLSLSLCYIYMCMYSIDIHVHVRMHVHVEVGITRRPYSQVDPMEPQYAPLGLEVLRIPIYTMDTTGAHTSDPCKEGTVPD